MCEQFEDALVIQTVASYTKILYAHHWKDTLCRVEKNPTMTEIVFYGYYRKLWLTLATISLDMCLEPFQYRACGLFLKKGGTISCVVNGPHQPRYSRDLEKLLRDQQCIS